MKKLILTLHSLAELTEEARKNAMGHAHAIIDPQVEAMLNAYITQTLQARGYQCSESSWNAETRQLEMLWKVKAADIQHLLKRHGLKIPRNAVLVFRRDKAGQTVVTVNGLLNSVARSSLSSEFHALTYQMNEALRDEISKVTGDDYIVRSIDHANMMFFADGSPWLPPNNFEEVLYAG